MRLLSILVLPVLAQLALAAATPLTLTGDTPILVNLTGEPEAVQLAIKDVEKDVYRVLGIPPVIVSDPADLAAFPATVPVVLLGTPAASSWLAAIPAVAHCVNGSWEQHCVVATQHWTRPVIVASGTGLRGAIFGAYAFAEEVLGVLPLHWWADAPPAYVGSSLTIDSSLNVSFPPPAFKYRGVFTNDEDLSGNHAPSPIGETVFSLDLWNRFFEASLRLKANHITPGTTPYPDEASTALAARRGLVVSASHFEILGSNVLRWPLGTRDWNFTREPATMSMMWRSCIAAQRDYEMVWTVGLRGLWDAGYPCNGGPVHCGRVVSEAMGNQTAWVRGTPGQEDVPIITYLWDEGLSYLQNGDLTIPDGVAVVFSDEGNGFIHGTPGNISRYADGIYNHVAMLSGSANQLTEMIPVSRIFEQMAYFVAYARSLTFAVINVSDLRPVLMTASAALDFLWDPSRYSAGSPNTTATAYMQRWCARYYGVNDTTAAAAADLWDAYFRVPFITAGHGDELVGRLTRHAATLAASDLRTQGTISAETVAYALHVQTSVNTSTGVQQFAPLVAAARSLLPALPPARRGFFQAHAVLNFVLYAEGVVAMGSVANATLALAQRNESVTAEAQLGAALLAFDTLFAAQRDAEGAAFWSGYYASDRLVDLHQVRRDVLDMLLAVRGARTALPPRGGGGYAGFEAYQLPFQVNYPRLHYDPDWNLDSWVRIVCNGTQPDGPPAGAGCRNRPDGGVFSGADAYVQVGLGTRTVHYTVDGSTPTLASPTTTYATPLKIADVTVIRAAALLDDGRLGSVSNATFVRG